MNRFLDIAIVLCAAIVLLPICILPAALPLAVFSVVTGIAVAPWIGTALAAPLAIYIARNAMASL